MADNNQYSIFDLGFDKDLNRSIQPTDPLAIQPISLGAFNGGLNDLIENVTQVQTFSGGVLTTKISVGADSNSAGIIAGTAATDIVFWAGATLENRTTAPFRITLDGALVATNATFSGTITATAGTIGGFTISSTQLSAVSGGNTTILSSGSTAISAGPTGSPTFTVTQAGAITATSGTIGGFTLTSTTLSATNLTLTSGAANTANISVGTGSNVAGLNSANGSTDIAFWAGDTFANRATAPFRVTAGGAVTATSISSSITATITPLSISYTSGDTLVAGNAVYLEDSSTTDVDIAFQTGSSTTQQFGLATGVQKLAQSFSIPGTGTFTLKSIGTTTAKVNAPVDDVKISIQADSAGDPSGTDLGSITADTTVDTSPDTISLSLTTNTTYWLVFSRTGALSDTNRYSATVDSTPSFKPSTVTFGAGLRTFDGSSWSSVTANSFVMRFLVTTVQGRVFAASGDTSGLSANFIGFATSNAGIGQTATIQLQNIFTSLSSLTVGSHYFLADYLNGGTASQARGSIATSAGTVSKKVGIATASTDLLINYSL